MLIPTQVQLYVYHDGDAGTDIGVCSYQRKYYCTCATIIPLTLGYAPTRARSAPPPSPACASTLSGPNTTLRSVR
eukprot:1223687-Rhodomonas_salina.1